MEIVVKLENFEGPFDLLLHLIEKRKVKIIDIKISELIDEYLSIINNLKKDSLQLKVEFVLIASELLEIKALELIKSQTQVEKEKDLKRRLEEYKMIKEVSEEISRLQNEYNISYSKNEGRKIVRIPSKEYNLKDLKQLDIFSAFEKFSKERELDYLTLDLEKNFSMEEEMEKLLIFICEKKREIEEVFQRAMNKMQLIYIFLSLLELYKDGDIIIDKNQIYQNKIHNREDE